MLDYNDLIRERDGLLSKRALVVQSLEVSSRSRGSMENSLNSISTELKSAIEREQALALRNEVAKATSKYDDLLVKFGNNKEKLLANKAKRLNDITYEKYSSEVADSLSSKDCLEKCKLLREKLKEKQGARLCDAVSSHISFEDDYLNLSDLDSIKSLFDDIETKLTQISSSKSYLGDTVDAVFSYDVDEEDSKKLLAFFIVCLLIVLIFFVVSPIVILAMFAFLVYNVYKSYFIYKCLRIVNSVEGSLDAINSSIESGITTKMNADKLFIENKFKSKLQQIESNLDKIEDKIVDITSNVKASFHFDKSRLEESYRIKSNSLEHKITLIKAECLAYEKSISELDKELAELNLKIKETSKTIYNEFYPNEFVDKGYLLPNKLLVDIVDSKPNIFTLPKGSACYLYKDEGCLFDFLNLYFSLLYNKLACSAFRIHYVDTKFVGTKATLFATLGNFLGSYSENEFTETTEGLVIEMMKRVGILAGKNIETYNKEILAIDSVPLSYDIVFDLFSNQSRLTDKARQLSINGYSQGIVYNSFIQMSDISHEPNNILWKILDTYDHFYLLTSNGLEKKSKKYFETTYKSKK